MDDGDATPKETRAKTGNPKCELGCDDLLQVLEARAQSKGMSWHSSMLEMSGSRPSSMELPAGCHKESPGKK